MKTVTKITFEMIVDGKRRRVIFVRDEKIADLLSAEDVTLGNFLRAMRDMTGESNDAG